MQVWRGVSVEAGVDRVWPWLCQVRLAPYSYDLLDNLGRRSPQQLRGLPDPVPGEPFTCVGSRFALGEVLAVSHHDHLPARIAGAVMSYVLVPADDATRLLLKIVQARGRWYAPALALGDLPMARRQLLNVKQLAESTA